MEDKWEHEKAKKYIGKDENILEVGCGRGEFVNELNKKGKKAVGIELNESAVRFAQSKGWNVKKEDLEIISKNEKKKYDTVCIFQVLEHVKKPAEFINMCLSCLKKGGQMIISVPNMNSFMGYDKNNLLNMPPHHMTQWYPKTFYKLKKYFPIRLKKIEFEPLARYHKSWYGSVGAKVLQEKALIPSILAKPIGHVISKIISFSFIRKKIQGHSQMVVFEKC
jgi:2-polyprenyl-3-methyl-5-hydroxy-6-metoxy-1,4-benzoquinol methylase